MKKLLLFALALSLSLAQAVRADNDNDQDAHHGHAAPPPRAAAAPAHRVAPRAVQRPMQRAVTPNRRAVNAREVQHAQATRQQVNRARAANEAAAARARAQHQDYNRNNARAAQANQRFNRGNANYAHHNNNYRHFDRNSFANARRHVIHQRHDRSWWRNRYRNSTFVLFGGGYYYLDAGYWYPAYGYSPIYNNYSYDEPIYSYNDLPPGQVLENVQIALRDQGYYQGPIDGLIGPETRAALAAYQRDHDLEQTAAVDEPTLVTLGLA